MKNAYKPLVLYPIATRGSEFYFHYKTHCYNYIIDKISNHPTISGILFSKIYSILGKNIPMIGKNKAIKKIVHNEIPLKFCFMHGQYKQICEQFLFYEGILRKCNNLPDHILLDDIEASYINEFADEQKYSVNSINHFCQKMKKEDVVCGYHAIDKIQIIIRMCAESKNEYIHVPKSILDLIQYKK